MITRFRTIPSLVSIVLVLVACAAPGASMDPPSSSNEVPASTPAVRASPSDHAFPDSCPTGIPSLEDVISVPIGDRPDCFGTADLTLRGWVFEELDPVYDCVTEPEKPMWLSCILSRQQLVAEEQAPAPWSEDLASLWVAADPDGPVGAIRLGARGGPVPVNTWVEVRGHFADPAAEACGPPGHPLRIECDGTLVLTDATRAVTRGAFASVTVNGLTVRSEPAVAAPPTACPGLPESVIRLGEGAVVLVLNDRPVTDGAYIWHRVVAPASDGAPAIGTRCDDIPFVAGWVASSAGGTDEWLIGKVECAPTPGTLAQLADLSTEPMRGLACVGSNEIRLTAALAPPPEGGIGFSCPGLDPVWLTCGIDRLVDGSTSTVVRLPEGATLETGVPANVSLHFDDPAASTCRSLADVDDDPAAIELFCRTQLVVGP
ncbi:MAG TPA: hypothetical protein VF365_03845 [Candidatus Limnocylindria bacterium]